MNNNITEDYCSFEVSKLLKEKGFDIPCYKAFLYRIALTGNDEIIGDITVIKNATKFSDSTTIKYWRPTHALAIKWIRENFGIHIQPNIISKEWYCEVHDLKKEGWLRKDGTTRGYPRTLFSDDGAYNTPEEAIEAALLYTLKHLI